jgi:hypothetical protein
VERVIGALEDRRRERALSGAIPPPLDQALEDFTQQLVTLRARADALDAPPQAP